jgi:hypothetical protein
LAGVEAAQVLILHRRQAVFSTVEKQLADLMLATWSATEKALVVFCWITRSQLYKNGNKCTALLAANKKLIESGAGLLMIIDQDMLRFNALLSVFYESGDPGELKAFLFEEALFGMEGPLFGNRITVGSRFDTESVGSGNRCCYLYASEYRTGATTWI